MADQKPATAKKKVRSKPPGYDQWSANRKEMYRAQQFARRLRLLCRAAQTNCEEASVLAMRGGNGLPPEETKLLRDLMADTAVTLRSVNATVAILKDIAYPEYSDDTHAA